MCTEPEKRVIDRGECVCDAALGWSEDRTSGTCVCGVVPGFTAVGELCVANDACTLVPERHCAPNTAVSPPQACSATDPRRCAACTLGYTYDAGTETVRCVPLEGHAGGMACVGAS